MSKKMLKRSLALGALMAFVITGSAFAEATVTDVYNVDGDNREVRLSVTGTVGKIEVDSWNLSTVIGDNEDGNPTTAGEYAVAIGHNATAAKNSVAIGSNGNENGTRAEVDSVAVGSGAKVYAEKGSAFGREAWVKDGATNSVAIGAWSEATEENTVSFGNTNTKRRLVNVAEGKETTDAVNLGQMNNALAGKADAATTLSGYGITDAYTKTEVDTKLGEKANAADVYTKTETDTKLDAKADNTALTTETSERVAADQVLQAQIDNIGGDSTAAINGLNQRLGKLNGKINKVGAGAAALAALHPLDYDPDDKLTFSAGMGNYAGENAAALGAFYRPNEKFMVSLGGTMGNGENMVNLGLSIGLDKPNGLAKLSKRELIQKVNAVEAENDALGDRVAKLEALVAQLASK